MTHLAGDVAILGSGFGGTLLAILAQRLGHRTVLLERGSHPRFAIGESSTPLADFKLAAIAERFGLDWLRPFAKYGSWKATQPQLPCGLKRGFSFFRHEAGQPYVPDADHRNTLLVAASPTDAAADTHWLRADFDTYLVERAVEAGVTYLDRFETHRLQHRGPGWHIAGARLDDEMTLDVGLLIDATGDGQTLGRVLDIALIEPSRLRARSRALYSHFVDVAPWHDVLQATCGTEATARHPFPCDAAALHHILDHGWMWVLRFDNGITSAGLSLDPDVHPVRAGEAPWTEWSRHLERYPSVARQFAAAQPVRPWIRTGRLQRRLARAAGADWALLPHAAGFLDPWLSPGIAQTLYAVNRLAHILADADDRETRLASYGETVLRELAWVDDITGTCFACFDRFEVMITVSMLYFVAAIFCEERARAGQADSDDAFLLADDPAYRALAAEVVRRAPTVRAAEAAEFAAWFATAIAPYNVAGLCDPTRHNLYPYISKNQGQR